MESPNQGWKKISNEYNINQTKLDIIIVLAGGLTEEGKLHEWVIRRLNKAIKLHKIYGVPILCCGGGTYHKKPFLNDFGFVVHESTECVNYLLQSGVDKNMIYREWSSYDTIANAFFSLTTHIRHNSSFKNIGVITSKFHLDRTMKIFDWIYSLDDIKYNMFYFKVSDDGLDKDMLKCRNEREKNSLQNIIKLQEKIDTLAKFSEWLYKEHNAYNNNFTLNENIVDKCKESY